MLLPGDTEPLLAAIRDPLPHDWLTGSFDERRAALLGLGIDGLERVPDGVLRLIDHRAGSGPDVALRFAAAARGLDGVALRPGHSKHEPW